MGKQMTVESLQPHTSVGMRVTAANALGAGFISLLLALGVHFSRELLPVSRGVTSYDWLPMTSAAQTVAGVLWLSVCCLLFLDFLGRRNRRLNLAHCEDFLFSF